MGEVQTTTTKGMSSVARSVTATIRRNLTIVAPIVAFAVFFIVGGILYQNFFTLRVFLNLLTDNAYLGLAAVGMTVVIISGGIDLSVGASISTSAMIIAVLDSAGVGAWVSVPLAIGFGMVLGFLMGLMIQFFDAPPFIVTLTGMFMARGIGYVLSLSSVPINGEFFVAMSGAGIKLPGGATLTMPAVIFLVMVIVTMFILRNTKFGRNVFALGGDEESAFLMGIPVARTKLLIYTFSGFCAGLGGVVYTFYTLAGYGLAGLGLELEAIASVVIGGTLLTGGFGSVLGSLFGVGIKGLIQTFITFQGTLMASWARVFVGALLFIFIVLQKVFLVSASRMKKPSASK